MTDAERDAARPMRVARWRWVLVPMVVVVAGCLPRPTPALPASFLDQFNGRSGNPTFTVQPPPAGKTGQEVVAAIRAGNPGPMPLGRAVPVFALVDCHGDPDCIPGPGGRRGEPARAVWVVLYPDCTDPTGNDIGWVVVDAVKGLAIGGVGLTGNVPCPPGGS
jgi:hypothetical protein